MEGPPGPFGGRLPTVLKANLLVLVGFIVATFFLPLSETERWVLTVAMTALAGLNWALLDHAKRRR